MRTLLALLALTAPLALADEHPTTRAGNLERAVATAKAQEGHWELRTFRRPGKHADGVGRGLQDVRIKLLPRGAAYALKVGDKVYAPPLGPEDAAKHPALKELRRDLVGFRDDYQGGGLWGLSVILDVRRDTPPEVYVPVIRLIAELWTDEAYAAAVRVGVTPLLVAVPEPVDERPEMPVILEEEAADPTRQKD